MAKECCLGSYRAGGGGFLGRRTIAPSYRKGNIWPWEGGGWGRSQAEGVRGTVLCRPSSFLMVLFQVLADQLHYFEIPLSFCLPQFSPVPTLTQRAESDLEPGRQSHLRSVEISAALLLARPPTPACPAPSPAFPCPSHPPHPQYPEPLNAGNLSQSSGAPCIEAKRDLPLLT